MIGGSKAIIRHGFNTMTVTYCRKLQIGAAVLSLFFALLISAPPFVIAANNKEAFRNYTDKLKRFSIKIPVTMKVEEIGPDEIRIYHPNATLRINIAIDKRLKKTRPNAAAFFEAFKQNLKLETRQLEVLKEAKLKNLPGEQAYVIYAFTDKRGIRLMQLYQYYATQDRFFQLSITDRIEGFKNLEKIISEIHGSLKILKPDLK